jgi:hypothetical protein
MSDTQDPRLSIGGNKGPIIPTKDEDLLEDLRRRYPEVEKKLAQFETDLKTYPEKLTLADEAVAASLQDLLSQMGKQKRVWASDRKDEKSPWDKLVKVVGNFFTKAEDKVDAHIALWKPRYEAFLELKRDESRRAAEAEAEKQRQAEIASRKAAEEAEERRKVAEAEAEAARAREAKARADAEKAGQDRKAAVERAEKAKAEEKRLADEKAERERAERASIVAGFKLLSTLMAEATKLNTLAEAGEATPEEVARLDELLRPHKGEIAETGRAINSSVLLDQEQRAAITVIGVDLSDLRQSASARADKQERERRQADEEKAEAAAAEARVARAKELADEEAKLAAAKATRMAEEQAAIDAKAAATAAKAGVRDARADQRGAVAEQKKEERAAERHEADADRSGNRADRMGRKIEGSTDADFSRTRADLGSVGSLSGRWHYEVVDEAKLRTVCGPLGEHFMPDALSGAVSRWMAAHRQAWTGERVTDPALPGVVFMWETEARIG